MSAERAPMRWPGAWKDPSALDLLKGTAINCLVIDRTGDLGRLAARARREGLEVIAGGSPPSGVTVVAGAWPGVRLARSGDGDQASTGPTGVPWVDSNGWRIRLAAARDPGTAVWVDVAPKDRLSTESYLIGVADAAAHGGRWVISLDSQLAAGIAGQKPEALETWKSITAAAAFFAARKEWAHYVPEAVMGVVSDFSGQNEFLSHEILNLVARTNQQYRIIPKSNVAESSFRGLRAVLYADAEPPASELRQRVLAFVQAGGMLIAGPQWGPREGAPARGAEHPRYDLRVLGNGRIAVAKADLTDPYLAANDSVVLISHRYELLRFWNAGAVGSYFTIGPDRKLAVAQLVFYASTRGEGGPTVRVAGRYRTARLWTLDHPAPRSVEMLQQRNDAVELHLPPVSVYAALELEV